MVVEMDGLKRRDSDWLPLGLALPGETPGEMPEQPLFEWSSERISPVAANPPATTFWRIFLFVGALALTAAAAWGLYEAMTVRQITELQILMLCLFVPNFAWIALWCMNGVIGFIALWRDRPTLLDARRSGRLQSRTALLFPVYNEAPARVLANAEAMADELTRAGAHDAFDVFILSDSTDPAAWLAEEAGYLELRDRLGDDAQVFYRHRPQNLARKSGNIADFCRRWGRQYDHFVVMDADSLMTGRALIRLVACMERHPEAGLIQTAPVPINGTTLFARLQQFAGHSCGPMIAAGMDRWCGGDGNYWGHNAIIRTRAFMEHAGLPALRGRKPFGGHILSHDFVEAALMRRAGWRLYMAPGVEGSYEESPPSLIDYAARDRRWCQGNLQHLAVLPARGLTAMSRLHLALGIWSYLASPLWFLFLAVGVLLALQAQFVRPEYFPAEFALFPAWPVINPKLAAWLFASTMAVLLAPRLLALIWFCRSRSAAAGFGGRAKAVAGLLLELLLSSLTAPILMLTQTQAVVGILLGRDVGWSTQRRDAGGLAFGEAFRRHRLHTAAGLLLGVAAYLVAPALLAWMSPLVLGLTLAIPLSMSGASAKLGRKLRRAGLLLTPPERVPEPILGRAAELRQVYQTAVPAVLDCISRLAEDDRLRHFHVAQLPQDAQPRRGSVDVDLLVALAKTDQCESLAEAAELLTTREAFALLGNAGAIARLMRLAPGAWPPSAQGTT